MSQNGCFRIAKRDVALLEHLQSCQRECVEQNHSGAALPPDMVNMVNRAALQFREDYEALQRARSGFRAVARDVTAQEAELRRRLRHAFAGFRHHKAAIARAGFTMAHFGLQVDGSFPAHLVRLREPLEIAKNLLKAHAEIAAKGKSYLFDPTEAELEQRIESLEQSLVARKQAKDSEQQALAQLRQTRTLVTRVLRTIRFYLQQMSIDLDTTRKRQMLRGYGFIWEPSRRKPEPTEGQYEDENRLEGVIRGGGSTPEQDEYKDEEPLRAHGKRGYPSHNPGNPQHIKRRRQPRTVPNRGPTTQPGVAAASPRRARLPRSQILRNML